MAKGIIIMGFGLRHIGILFAMVAVIIITNVTAENLRMLYLFAIPIVYAILVYRPPGVQHSGIDFFKNVIHYCRTPQSYRLTSRILYRKDDENDATD